MIDLLRIAIGLVCSALIGGAAYWRGALTRSGWLGAILTGTLTFGFGGWAWGLTLIAFFISSTVLSKLGEAEKLRRAGDMFAKGGRRDIWQTLANGGIGALLALLYGVLGEPAAPLALFVGVMATVTADTWATEIGTLSAARPVSIVTWRAVAPGTSGGISLPGTLATVGGALFIGLMFAGLRWWERGAVAPALVVAGLIGGVAGSLSDSLLGATLQAIYRGVSGETERRADDAGRPNPMLRGLGWMTNDAVNLTSSLIGGAVALLVALALSR